MSSESFSLYRYRTINKHLIEAIVNKSLYFARPDELNDPFDCLIDIKMMFQKAIAMTPDEERKKLLSVYLDTEGFFENWRSHIDEVGLCCFSEAQNIPLLWAHYADGHKGLCLEYTFSEADFAPDGNGPFATAVMGNVQYVDSPLSHFLLGGPINELKGSVLDHENQEADSFRKSLLRHYLFSKNPTWSYEKESRFLRTESGVYKPNIDRPLITKICFGLRTPPEEIALITKLAKDYSAGVTFTHMVRDETEFGFTEVPL